MHLESYATQHRTNNNRCSSVCAEKIRLVARAIHGHLTITSFDVCDFAHYEASDASYSALAKLPSLESIGLSNSELRTRLEDESALSNPESLLRVPTLRIVRFDNFSFTLDLCQVAVNALHGRHGDHQP